MMMVIIGFISALAQADQIGQFAVQADENTIHVFSSAIKGMAQ